MRRAAIIFVAGGVALLCCGQAYQPTSPPQRCPFKNKRLCGPASGPLFVWDGGMAEANKTASGWNTDPRPFCISMDVSTKGDAGWAEDIVAMGAVVIGNAYQANNSISLYLSPGKPGNVFYSLDICDGTGCSAHHVSGGSNFQATQDPQTPVGKLGFGREKIAACIDGTTLKWYQNGQLSTTETGLTTVGALNLPNNIHIGGLSTQYLWTQTASDTLNALCIAGRTGSATGNPVTDVKNSCGQFTATNPTLAKRYSCFRCLGAAPAGGATKVLALGDSITQAATGAYRPWPARLNALLGTGYDVTNAGNSGDTVAQIKARYDASYRAGGYATCIFMGGINDIMRDGATAVATTATATALLDEMRSDCTRVVVSNETPAGNSVWYTAPHQTEWDTYASDLAAYVVANPSNTVLADTFAALSDGASPPKLKSACDVSDHVHPAQICMDVLADVIRPGVP